MFRRRVPPPRPTGTYTDWRWPPNPDGYTRFDWTLTPERDPSPDGYFWSHQFGLVGGEGGYAGLQTMGSNPTGKIAIFSIWGAESATGPAMAGAFGGEGTGQTVRIPYRWRPGAAYRLSVCADDAATWTAVIADAVTGEEHLIGHIRVPRHWGGLSDFSIMWTERYAGALRSCADIRRSSARFTIPTASGAGGGRVMPLHHHNHLAEPPGCPGSEVIDLAGGVRHVMGETEVPDRNRPS